MGSTSSLTGFETPYASARQGSEALFANHRLGAFPQSSSKIPCRRPRDTQEKASMSAVEDIPCHHGRVPVPGSARSKPVGGRPHRAEVGLLDLLPTGLSLSLL